MTNHPSVILFDWDNTLCDSFMSLLDSANYTLALYGKEQWSVEDGKRNIRKAGHEMYPLIYGDLWEEAIAKYRAYYYDHYANVPLFEGAQDIIESIRAKRIKTGIISNKGDSYLKINVDTLGIGHLFDVVMGSQVGIPGKPAPDMMDKALADIGYDGPREKVWYVGDTDLDMEFAVNSGAKPIFVANIGLDTVEDITGRYQPYGAYQNIAELAALLD